MSELVVHSDESIVGALVDGKQLPEARIEDPAMIALQITQQILQAADVDAIFAVTDSTPMQELLGVGIEVDDVTFNASSFKDGPPVYALVHGKRLDDGSRITSSCGGRSIMAALFRMKQLGAFPQRIKVEQSKKANADGNHTLILKRA